MSASVEAERTSAAPGPDGPDADAPDEPVEDAGSDAGWTTVVAANLAAGAVTLLVVLIIVLLAALVGGEFAAAIPSNSTFSSAIKTTTDNAGTAFTIFGVSLLAIPAVAVLAYIITRLGGFFGMGRTGMGR